MAHRTGTLGSSPSWPLRGLGPWLHSARRRWKRSREVAAGLSLSDGRAWSGRIGAGGVAVRCVAGTALLTREGDPSDHVLVGGDVFRSERPGRLALMALGAAEVTVTGDLR